VPSNTLQATTFSADDTRLITASQDGVIRAWNPETGRAAMQPLRDLGPEAATVAASRDGKFLASGDAGGLVALWDATTGQVVRRLRALPEKVFSVNFSPDGQRMAASGMRGLFALWETATGRLIFQAPKSEHSALASLAFSPDGRYVVTADRAQKILKLWDGRNGRPINRRFDGQESPVEAVAFSPDGQFVASGEGAMGIRFWDVKTGEPIGGQFLVGGWVSALAFSADGQYLAASSDSMNVLRVWQGPTAWAATLCRRLTRNMSHSEWNQYVGPSWPYTKQCPNLPVPLG
jgi:WD40 repeat protein